MESIGESLDDCSGNQTGPVGDDILRRDGVCRHDILAYSYPDQRRGALGSVAGNENHLAEQVDAFIAAHGRNQLGRVNRHGADIRRTQGVVDRLQVGSGQDQGIITQGGFDGQRRAYSGRSHRDALIQQGDAQGQLVAAHQGQVGDRDAAGEHDGHGGQINQQLHSRYQ